MKTDNKYKYNVNFNNNHLTNGTLITQIDTLYNIIIVFESLNRLQIIIYEKFILTVN